MGIAGGLKNVQVAQWIIEEKLGEGGFGSVWRARHVVLERRVAIKMMAEHLLDDPGFRARFIHEARAQAKLQHPNIISVNDFFTEQDRDYLVMPFVDGGSLDKRLRMGGALPLEEALRYSQHILGALDYAHQQGVIHRDVKPSNILMDRTGHVYLADFSIAILIGQPRRTQTGAVIGSADYMSPEQIKRPKELDHRTDVYSFGCVLYQMLTGRPPFVGNPEMGDIDFYIKECHLTVAPPRLRQFNEAVPEAIEQIVMRALAKDPSDRFSGCGEFARALSQATQEQSNYISCAACGHQNKIEKFEMLAEATCVHCGKPLSSNLDDHVAEPGFPKLGSTDPEVGIGRRAIGIWAVVASILLLITSVGWSNSVDRERQTNDLLSKANTVKADEFKQLDKERTLRSNLSKGMEVSLVDVKVRNEDLKDNALSDYTDRFSKDSIRYITYHITLQNNCVDFKDSVGTLGVKFINPDGTVRRVGTSPDPLFEPYLNPYTHEKEFKISDAIDTSWGLGSDRTGIFNVGKYRIEFWWNGTKIGETSFTVYDSHP